MKQLQLPLRLGQRVYGVTTSGRIFPTLINEITLTTEPETDEFVRTFDLMLSGKSHALSDMPLRFRTLSHSYKKVFLHFTEALEYAKERVVGYLIDPHVSLADLCQFQKRLQRYRDDPDQVHAEVDVVETFAESQTGMLRRGEPGVYETADFPKRYYEPGASVWAIDYKHTKLIAGFVTEVGFAPKRESGVRYSCGSYVNLGADAVCGSKETALKRLRADFEAKHPAKLDARQVPVEKQISRDEKHRRDVDRFFGRKNKS